MRPHYWQTDTSVSVSSWGYVEGKSDFKSARALLHDLLDIVSKNGNLLLNVGPKGDGTIPADAAALLEELGAWLRVNGEAVYGTRPWRCYGEGQQKVVQGQMTEKRNGGLGAGDVRFTAAKDGRSLYAHLLAWPPRAVATVSALAAHEEVSEVRLLGHAAPLPFERAPGGALRVTMPREPPPGVRDAFVLKLALAAPAASPTFGASPSTKSCLR